MIRARLARRLHGDLAEEVMVRRSIIVWGVVTVLGIAAGGCDVGEGDETIVPKEVTIHDPLEPSASTTKAKAGEADITSKKSGSARAEARPVDGGVPLHRD